MPEALLSDVVLDLVQILDEACDGRLVGGEDITLDEVSPDMERDTILLTLSSGEKVELRVRFQ